jgi:hypothetical protein
MLHRPTPLEERVIGGGAGVQARIEKRARSFVIKVLERDTFRDPKVEAWANPAGKEVKITVRAWFGLWDYVLRMDSTGLTLTNNMEHFRIEMAGQPIVNTFKDLLSEVSGGIAPDALNTRAKIHALAYRMREWPSMFDVRSAEL